MSHDRHGVSAAQPHPGRLQQRCGRLPRRVNVLGRKLRQLGHIAADEIAARIEFLALRHRVENAEVRLRIAAAARRPLPAAVVGRQIEIVEMIGKVALAPAPVDAQVFGQKTRNHHAQAVVHIAGLVDLAHGRVHQRIAGAALAPGGELRRVVAPLNAVVNRLESRIHHMRMVEQNLKIKVAPHQLGQPDPGPLAARLLPRPGHRNQLAHRDRAEAQVHREIARPLARRVVARLVVVIDATAEVVHQRRRARRAQRQFQRVQIRRRKTQLGQGGQRLPQRRWQRGQPGGGHRAIDGLLRLCGVPRQPGGAVGRKDRVRFALGRQHLVALENHVLFDGAQRPPVLPQGALDGRIAREGFGLIVASAEHRLRAQLGSQRGDRLARAGVAHDQRGAVFAQSGVDLRHRRQDELHPPIRLQPALQQRIENVSVEHKRQRHLVAGAQGGVQRRVVVQAQIAPQPDQTERQFFHGRAGGTVGNGSRHVQRVREKMEINHNPAAQNLRPGAINSTS